LEHPSDLSTKLTLCFRTWNSGSPSNPKHLLFGIERHRFVSENAKSTGKTNMPQTIGAFLAMLITSLLAINQQRAVLQSYEKMADDAMEVMSSGVALQCMDFISRKSFDDAVVGGFVTDPSQLEDLPFGSNVACDMTGNGGACDDIDDFHQMSPDTLAFVARNGNMVEFTVTSEVFYVDQSLNPDSMVTYETYAKMIVVEVQDVEGVMRSPSRLSRLITCDVSKGCN
jgi:hypothetical protein